MKFIHHELSNLIGLFEQTTVHSCSSEPSHLYTKMFSYKISTGQLVQLFTITLILLHCQFDQVRR